MLISSSPHAPEISARVGAAAFIPKPYDPDEMVVTIDRVTGATRPVKLIEEDEEPTGPVRISS